MKQTKILILCVTYNSDSELQNYLQSLSVSVGKTQDVFVDVFVADNSTEKAANINSKCDNINVNVLKFNENLGYLGGISAIIQAKPEIPFETYDFVIISNVDIQVSENFFEELAKNKNRNEIGWLAPKIWSISEKRDRNPNRLKRYTKLEIEILRLIYRFAWLHRLYVSLFYNIKKGKTTEQEIEIYAGHGSIMIFNALFFSKIKNFHFPAFLFGEEIFFAELVSKHGLKVRYIPSIKITDTDHVSTGKMKHKHVCQLNFKALTALKNMFYKQN
ncbi:MAG: glycosyltransferase [Prevotellaceae bacterium]|jgi:GT2 family glycosyltransferase|nr:glycosyltransferase [Prevotellaceae bacterium]